MISLLGRSFATLVVAGFLTVGLGDVSRSHALDIQVLFPEVTSATGSGFDDPVLGSTRQATFLAAAQYWADSLPAVSGATSVGIQTQFDTGFACSKNASTGFLVFKQTGGNINLPLSNTDYPSAFAKSLDSDVTSPIIDFLVRFNSKFDDPGVPCGKTWFYGTDSTGIPSNGFYFYDAAMHEIAHGLGMTTTIQSDGSWENGVQDVYSTLVWRDTLQLVLTDQTMTQRSESIVSSINLQWTGRHGTERARAVVSCGLNCTLPGGRFWLHAPPTFAPGVSVSHVDFGIESDGRKELMVPLATSGVVRSNELTVPMLRDMGWACAGDCSGDFAVSISELVTSVNIALDRAPFANCAGGDGDYDGDISIDDLVRSVNNALDGCLRGPQIVEVPTAQAQVVVASGQGVAGQTVSIPVSVLGLSGEGAAVQLDLFYADAPLNLIGCTLNVSGGQHAINHEVIQVISGQSHNRIAVHPDDLSTDVISFADGVVATCEFEIASGAAPGNYPLVVADESVCDVDGVDFDTTYTDGQIQVCTGCGCG